MTVSLSTPPLDLTHQSFGSEEQPKASLVVNKIDKAAACLNANVRPEQQAPD
jgi:hypothetical protein